MLLLCYCFFVMTLRPPRSTRTYTLFPYTTLFRSSHIVVPKLYDGDHAYIVQLADRRIVFAVPWQDGFTQVGTTDIAVDNPKDAQIDADEIAYLCAAINAHFRSDVTPADIVDSWSGIRPLYDDGACEAKAVTRDFVLEQIGRAHV